MLNLPTGLKNNERRDATLDSYKHVRARGSRRRANLTLKFLRHDTVATNLIRTILLLSDWDR